MILIVVFCVNPWVWTTYHDVDFFCLGLVSKDHRKKNTHLIDHSEDPIRNTNDEKTRKNNKPKQRDNKSLKKTDMKKKPTKKNDRPKQQSKRNLKKADIKKKQMKKNERWKMFIYETIYEEQLTDVIQRVDVFERDNIFTLRNSSAAVSSSNFI